MTQGKFKGTTIKFPTQIKWSEAVKKRHVFYIEVNEQTLRLKCEFNWLLHLSQLTGKDFETLLEPEEVDRFQEPWAVVFLTRNIAG